MVCSKNGGRSHTLQSLSFSLWNLGNEHYVFKDVCFHVSCLVIGAC